MSPFTESVIEQAALAWLEGAGWSVRHAEVAPSEPGAERSDYGQIVIEQRLHDALARLNPDIPAEGGFAMSASAGTPGGEVVVYEAPDGEVRVDVRLERETVWLTQEQMSQLFERERSVITKHVRNVFKEGELDPKSVCAKFAHTAAD
ncbi:MAG: hypothetical protein ACRD1T_20270, partial [Acidimicrobiia bacterium]